MVEQVKQLEPGKIMVLTLHDGSEYCLLAYDDLEHIAKLAGLEFDESNPE